MAEKREHLTPIFQQNEILFGHDSTPGLIAFEVVGNNKVKIFRRRDGRIETELAPFRPFMLLEGDGTLKDWKGEAELQKLDGQGAFNRLALFPDLNQLEHARFHAQKKSGKTSSGPDAPYWYFSDPLHQFLILSGKTHFLGMTFGDLKRLQLDIETYCPPGFEFPHAYRDSDRITAIALSDSTGWERLISGKEFDEAQMLQELVNEIQRRDPDVIEGHNLFRFGLEYIEARAKRQKVELKVGRDGSGLKSHGSRLQMAERTITYRRYEIFGRNLIDTWMLAQHYDIATRELESVSLNEIARHLGIASADRTYIPAGKAGISITIRTRCFATPSTTCAKPAPSQNYYRRVISFKRRFFLIAIKIFRCAGTRRKSMRSSSVNMSTNAARCLVRTTAARSPAALRIWSTKARRGAFSIAT
jgi:DNA polymerase I